MTSLWSHQQRAIDQTRECIQRGQRRVCIVVPTGGGKTALASVMISNHVAQGGKALFIAAREELVQQAASVLTTSGLNVGLILSGNEMNLDRPVQVASIQTLLARDIRPDSTLVVLDEARHYMASKWNSIPQHYADKICIGLDATPELAGGAPLSFFQALVTPTSVKELTSLGVLVPCEVIRPKKPLGPGRIAQNPLEAYKSHASSMKTILFAANTVAAEQYLTEFKSAGIRAAFVSYKSADRSSIMSAYHNNQLDVLINIGIATEGFDDKETSCVIIARTCGSAGLAIQMWGRALRSSPGKTSALLLDLNGVTHIHGMPDEDRLYSLTGTAIRRKSDPAMYKFCNVCGYVLKKNETICPDCGLAGKIMEAPKVTGDKIDKFEWLKKQSPEYKMKHWLKLLGDGANAGHKPGRAYFKFKSIYGHEPPKR